MRLALGLIKIATLIKSQNITRVGHRITAAERYARNGHRGGVVWLTGLPGAGKTTLALALEKHLFDAGMQTYVLDGDNIRHGLSGDLGFSEDSRRENIRRVSEVAGLFAEAGIIAISAFISPYRQERQLARKIAGDNFIEVFLAASVDVCEARDPKGLYKKARAGQIKNFTGIDAPYEQPKNPELVLDTSTGQIGACVEQIADLVKSRFAI